MYTVTALCYSLSFSDCLQMASSNVDYYQKQKDLQDKMHARYTFD